MYNLLWPFKCIYLKKSDEKPEIRAARKMGKSAKSRRPKKQTVCSRASTKILLREKNN